MNQVTICNLALARINQKTIQAIDEANSVGAQFCDLFYDHTRQWLLRKHPWGFAKSSTALAQTANTPLGWDFEYKIPTGTQRIWSIVDQSGAGAELVRTFVGGEMVYKPMASSSSPIEYDVVGDTIVTNLEQAYAIYAQNIEDVSKFDAMFTDAFAWKLAFEIAMPVSGKMALRKQAADGFTTAMGNAMQASSSERRVRQVVGYDLVEARL
jgi:hypothetical protein